MLDSWLSPLIPNGFPMLFQCPKRMARCVYYKYLNRASPKDDFPLPHIDILVENTAQHKVFFFMGGFSGYNQIKMALEDMEETTFSHNGAYSATR